MFDHIVSKNMWNWGFFNHTLPSNDFVQSACLKCAKNTLRCMINFGQVICPY